jgi:hypothetical protein
MVFTLTTTAAMDNSAPFSTHPIALIYRGKPVQINRATSKRPYQPRDMSAHLFPPEDVARFQEMRQINSSPASNDEKTHVV